MSVTRVKTPEHVVISHPSEPDWILGCMNPLDESRIEEIQHGLGMDEKGIAVVVNALKVVTARTSTYRHMHENVNVQRLGLSETEHAEYRRLAGKHDSKADFVRWFSLRAQEHFDSLTEGVHASKVVLDAGGVRQGGHWETGGLDQVFRNLETDLLAIEPDMKMKKFEGEVLLDNPIKYKEIPMQGVYGSTGRIDFVTARRRRPVANVRVTGGNELKISKEATALIVLDTLPRDQRMLIRERAIKDADLSNSKAALAIGEVFDQALNVYHNGSEQFGVLPISAHYVATAEPTR